MIFFDCWSGMSLSELIALGWDDVDLEAGTAKAVNAMPSLIRCTHSLSGNYTSLATQGID
ncbi:hypothetical protein Pres01_30810 [Metapseudomonas resinovorans]|uniref:hypothetical protein n=1 Tax=Metapseudomonas resinovorans TaxID=53412 RepID=UPI00098608C8|nr:hypothetical protein [Pseudomonas resinovorans]GLZ87030.1 hypothetical protein Pres01_30810 [Pseudomonas resinovorans]